MTATAVSNHEAISVLEKTSVIAVVRLDTSADVPHLADAVHEGGVRMIEITMTVPGALEAIERTVREVDSGVLIGAGTVLSADVARQAVSVGASFIVSPALDLDVVRVVRSLGVAVIPGCLSPTEVSQAHRAMADAVKLFPGRIATPGYLRDLKGPFPDVRMLPTGNVDLKTAPEYIRAGAIAVGVGKAIIDQAAVTAGDWKTIAQRARAFRKVVDEAKVSA